MHPVLALFRRNAWATEQLLKFCDGRPDVDASAETDVYGGIEPMFNHIISAETGYFRLVTGELPTDRVLESNPRPLRDLLEPARWLAERWPTALPLIQTLHHGDDHRTQIATLLGRRGVEAPELDGWAFEEVAAGNGAARDWWGPLLRRFFGYHLWATERLLEQCRALTPEQLELSAPGTFGSIGATLDHLVSSDRSYLSRLMGGKRMPPLNAGGPGPLLEHLARQREDWMTYLDSKPDFDVMIERTDGHSPAWIVVLQAIHHGNDHRTHAGTVLLHHQLGEVEIDVWNYGLAEDVLKPLPSA
jgi:uncharacterized damage-inducible protein DinB